MTIGEGKMQNYTALLLFLAGMVAGGAAVYYSRALGRAHGAGAALLQELQVSL
jgi:hypothetical protein